MPNIDIWAGVPRPHTFFLFKRERKDTTHLQSQISPADFSFEVDKILKLSS